jgi:hypothetical protein
MGSKIAGGAHVLSSPLPPSLPPHPPLHPPPPAAASAANPPCRPAPRLVKPRAPAPRRPPLRQPHPRAHARPPARCHSSSGLRPACSRQGPHPWAGSTCSRPPRGARRRRLGPHVAGRPGGAGGLEEGRVAGRGGQQVPEVGRGQRAAGRRGPAGPPAGGRRAGAGRGRPGGARPRRPPAWGRRPAAPSTGHARSA